MTQRRSVGMGALVHERGQHLFGYAYVLTGSPTAADALARSALVKVYAARRGPLDVAAAETSVMRAMRALVFNGAAPRTPGSDGDSGDPRPPLDRALDLLGPRDRVCLAMRFLDDMTTQAISTELRISLTAVRTHVRDAVKGLESVLGDLGISIDDVFHGGTETVSIISIPARAA